MTWWHRLWRRKQMEEQLERELRFHLDQHTADLIARGHDPAEARRLARLAFGGPEQVKEECRDARGTRWLECGRTSGMPCAGCAATRGFLPSASLHWRWALAPARRFSAR